MFNRVVLVVSLFLVHETALAQTPSPNDIFFSPEVLEEAQHDIADMSIDELRLFADSIAQCTPSVHEHERYPCDVARERYTIEYSRERALDRLLAAIYLTDALLYLNEETGKAIDTDMVMRYSEVTISLKNTANRVFYVLRLANEPN